VVVSDRAYSQPQFFWKVWGGTSLVMTVVPLLAGQSREMVRVGDEIME